MISGNNFVITFLPDLGIYCKTYTGVVSIDDIIGQLKTIKKCAFPQNLHIIENWLCAEFKDVNLQRISELVDVVEETMKEFETVKMALLLKKPVEQAQAIMFLRRAEHLKNLQMKVFTTYKGAVNWLCSNPYVLLLNGTKNSSSEK